MWPSDRAAEGCSAQSYIDDLVTRAVQCLDAGDWREAGEAVAQAQAAIINHQDIDGPMDAATTAGVDLVEGQLFGQLGDLMTALECFERAGRCLTTATSTEARLLYNHAQTDEAATLRQLGRIDEAQVVLSAAWKQASDDFGTDSVAAARVHNEIGLALKAAGEYARATEHYMLALPVLTRAYGEVSSEVASLHHNLGGIHFVRGRLVEAEEWARRGVEVRAQVHGAEHIAVTFDEAALAPILIHGGQMAEARILLDRVLPRLEQAFGADHYEVASALSNLGALHAHDGRWNDAYACLDEAVRIKRKVLGPDSPELVSTLANLAAVAERIDAPAIAREAAGEALRIAQHALPAEHPLRRRIESS